METLASTIEWGIASRALTGQPSSGDLHVVKSFQDGVLVAAVDGIGHGEEAALVAGLAGTILQTHAQEPVTELLLRCHDGLRLTRGVAMSLASFNTANRSMTWLGVGNVQGTLLRPSAERPAAGPSLLLRSGVVGVQLPALHAETLPVSRGDTLVLATDGIENDFARQIGMNLPPQKAAEIILARYGKATDDALVLVARYFGDHP